MKNLLRFTLASIMVSSGVLAGDTTSRNHQEHFFHELLRLCGASFTGQTVYPDDPSHDFAGKKLVAQLATCNEEQIQIPFTVGEDRSRTWIISLNKNGLLLKHDHRHADGTPDEITMYGGWANDQGSSSKQFFEADQHTAKLIPAAKTNVWMIELDSKQGTLTYYLERNQQPRYRAQLKRHGSENPS